MCQQHQENILIPWVLGTIFVSCQHSEIIHCEGLNDWFRPLNSRESSVEAFMHDSTETNMAEWENPSEKTNFTSGSNMLAGSIGGRLGSVFKQKMPAHEIPELPFVRAYAEFQRKVLEGCEPKGNEKDSEGKTTLKWSED